MSLTYDGWVLADVSVPLVVLSAGLGNYNLRLSIQLRTTAHPQKRYCLSDVRAKVSVVAGANEYYVGVALPESPMRLTFEHSRPESRLFEIGLSPAQMAVLEELRNGGDLTLRVDLQGLADNGPGSQTWPVLENLRVSSPQSDWVKQLNQSGFSKRLLLEVPVFAPGAMEGHSGVHQHVSAAIDHLNKGHYPDAVASCRKALEGLDAAEGVTSREDALRAFRDDPRGMLSEQRATLVDYAVRHYTQLPHHADGPAQLAQYGRREAIWAITMVIAIARRRLGG